MKLVFFHFYNSSSGGGQSIRKCRGHGRFHLKMQITDIKYMLLAVGGGGGDGGDGRLGTSTEEKVNHAVTSTQS